jgi:hypothetical protein
MLFKQFTPTATMEFKEEKHEKDGQRRKRFLKFLREEIPAEMTRRVEMEGLTERG